MTPLDRATALARRICVCTCYSPKAAPADGRGPLKDGSHYTNCPADDVEGVAADIAAAIRAAVEAERGECAKIVEELPIETIFGLRPKLAAAIRERKS